MKSSIFLQTNLRLKHLPQKLFSTMSGKIIDCAHDFCNKKIRENQNPIPVFFPENNEDFSLILETFQKDSYDEEDNNNDNCKICGKKKLTSLSLWIMLRV